MYSILTELNAQIEEDKITLDRISKFINPYLIKETENITEDDNATIAILFKEEHTITSFKQFTKTISSWNRILPLYHQLLKSESPEDIKIVQVQNGSIDFVLNIDLDIALNLVDLFKVGFQVFGAYLSYKQMIKPIIESYHGNRKLINQEEDREKLLLENIGAAIDKEIKSQYRAAKKLDANIDGTAITKKVEQVTKLITSHIIKGNDFKLIALPNDVEIEDDISTIKERLRNQSIKARRELSFITTDAQQKLLEVYGKVDDEDVT